MLGLEAALLGRVIAAFFSFLFCSASLLALMACIITMASVTSLERGVAAVVFQSVSWLLRQWHHAGVAGLW